MAKPVDILKRIEQGKSVLPLTWAEWWQSAGALAFVVFVGMPVLILVIVGLVKTYASLLSALF